MPFEILDSIAFGERFEAQGESRRSSLGAPWAPGFDTRRQAPVLLQWIPWWEGVRKPGRFSVKLDDSLFRVARIEHPGLARPVAAAETPEGLTHAVEWEGVRGLEDVLCEIPDPWERMRLGAARVAEVLDVVRVLAENGLAHLNVFGPSMGVAPDGTARLSGAVGVVARDMRPMHAMEAMTFTAGEQLGVKCCLVGPALFLYQLFTGLEPYPHARALLLTQPPPQEVEDLNPAVPPGLAERIMRLVCSWHQIRDVDVGEELEGLRLDLAAFRAELDETVSSAPAPPETDGV